MMFLHGDQTKNAKSLSKEHNLDADTHTDTHRHDTEGTDTEGTVACCAFSN